MAPVSEKSSQFILCRVKLAGIPVDELVDTGATASCCRWDWYQEKKSHLGPLRKTSKVVVGVENSPVQLNGVLGPVLLEWDQASGYFDLLVLPSLEDVDIIIGMDILSQLGVRIDTKLGSANPCYSGEDDSRPAMAALILDRTVRLPVGKSRIFFVNAPRLEGLTLFEPSIKLPDGVQGIPSLGKGPWVAIQLDNLTEEEVVLNPEWTIGQLFPVQLVVKPPLEDGSNLQEIPKDLNSHQYSN